MAMKFGAKMVNNPTPRSISKLFDGMAAMCGIVASFLQMAEFVPSAISDPVSITLTGLVIPMLLYFKKWFGEEVTTDYVKTEDVSEIKDQDNKP